jgi:hypothetical protein
VGGKVKAKALRVTWNSEAARRYGNQKKLKMIPGIVVGIDFEHKVTNKRPLWFVTADWDFGAGEIKRKRMNIASVKVRSQASIPCLLSQSLRLAPTNTEGSHPLTTFY